MSDERLIRDMIADSPWRNSYFFARDLLNTDKYGSVGHKDSLMREIISTCEGILGSSHLTDSEKLQTAKQYITSEIQAGFNGPKINILVRNFTDRMENSLMSIDDLVVFIVTAKFVVLPTNEAMQRVPSSDREFSEKVVGSVLRALGPAGISKAISMWDDFGTNGCLSIERDEVILEFVKLRNNLQAMKYSLTELDKSIVLTAFVQEFERRLGQKRKSRAGGSLEDVTGFLFRFFNIKAADAPEHFQTDIEVDKWFKCSDGWLVGISCKRTLRERWKQVSSATAGIMGTYHIKEIWHLITYDKDLSDDKIAMLGNQHQFFYLDDNSPRYEYCTKHSLLCSYVRPLSGFISDIYRLQGKTLKPDWS